jgi:hypothetical protein
MALPPFVAARVMVLLLSLIERRTLFVRATVDFVALR